MKAVIMEKKQNEYVILCDDGTFRKITGNYVVGQEIEYSDAINASSYKTNSHIKSTAKNHLKLKYKYFASIAAAAIIFLGIGAYQVVFACSYVTLDVNPSIEYTLNRLNRVIAVTALNDDASDVVESLSSSGITMSTLEDAIDITIDELQSRGYLTDDEGAVLIDIVSDNENVQQSLQEDVSSTDIFNSESTSVVCLSSEISDRTTAAEQGISTGRYEVMLETENIPAVDTEDQSATDSYTYLDSDSNINLDNDSEKSFTKTANQIPTDGNLIDAYRNASVSDLINDLAEKSVPTINNYGISSDNDQSEDIDNTTDSSSETNGPDVNSDSESKNDFENGISSDENMDSLPDNSTNGNVESDQNNSNNSELPSAPENDFNEDSAPQENFPGTEGNNDSSDMLPDGNTFDKKGADRTGGPLR